MFAVVRAAPWSLFTEAKGSWGGGGGLSLRPAVPALSTSLIPNNITLGSGFKQSLPATPSAEMLREVLGSHMDHIALCTIVYTALV